MDIKFVGEYKAVKSFEIHDLPALTIITGKNGVGKSQLLELLYGQYGTHCIEIAPKIKNKMLLKSSFCLSTIEPINLLKLQDILLNKPSNENSYSQTHRNKLKSKFAGGSLLRTENNKIEINTLLDKFSFQEFYKSYKNDIKEPNFGLEVLFFIYYYKYVLKKLDLMNRNKDFNEKEILEDLGPAPWNIVNEFLRMIDSPYEINNPITDLGMNIIGEYTPAFIDSSRGIRLTHLSNLSSGENIMISLAFWLYAARNENIFPELILLDEPDAHLHPEFIKKFLRILNEICLKYNTRIIMTTHSPVTIALAPENSIYEMQRNRTPIIIPSKSILNSIHMLCSGMLVFQPNKRYIMTEDDIDSKVYSAIYKILKDKNILSENNIELSFLPISNWEQKVSGGKNKVIEFVNKIQDINKDNGIIVKGLLDLDNEPVINNDNLIQINRYSIENYLLDPINIFATILNNGYNITDIPISIGEESNIALLENWQLQKIADSIIEDISLKLPTDIKKNNCKKIIQYLNGKEIICPEWFFVINGHILMQYCQKAFLNGHKLIYSDNLINNLKRTTMIPVDLVEIINKLSSEKIEV